MNELQQQTIESYNKRHVQLFYHFFLVNIAPPDEDHKDGASNLITLSIMEVSRCSQQMNSLFTSTV